MRYWSLKAAHAAHPQWSAVLFLKHAGGFSWLHIRCQRHKLRSCCSCLFFSELRKIPRPRAGDKSCLTPRLRVMALHVRWCLPMLNLISRQAAFRDTYILTAHNHRFKIIQLLIISWLNSYLARDKQSTVITGFALSEQQPQPQRHSVSCSEMKKNSHFHILEPETSKFGAFCCY